MMPAMPHIDCAAYGIYANESILVAVRCVAMMTAAPAEPSTDAKGLEESLRFGFGRNWSDFIAQHCAESRGESSKCHILKALRVESLAGLSFLDIGCGSGLHSLAALRADAASVEAVTVAGVAISPGAGLSCSLGLLGEALDTVYSPPQGYEDALRALDRVAIVA